MEKSIYRIIDANFNRAREAIRVIEDFCRFALDHGQLAQRAKQLRHELSGAINKLNANQLISSRDTLGDVGIGCEVNEQMRRRDLQDCMTAAGKRLVEALRVISEAAQTLEPSVAQTVENLRYKAYTLEKDVAFASAANEKFSKVNLYVIISSSLPADVISLTHRCIAGQADCIQMRAKNIPDNQLFTLAVEFVEICKQAKIVSIINDRIDIAVASRADGVHLGQNDLPTEQVRKLMPEPMIIGKSTHNLTELQAAVVEQPTYVSLGPVFPSRTKPKIEVAGLDYVREASKRLVDTGIAPVAIGGITAENVEQVLNADIRAIAVGSAVTEADESANVCRKLKEKLAAFCG